MSGNKEEPRKIVVDEESSEDSPRVRNVQLRRENVGRRRRIIHQANESDIILLRGMMEEPKPKKKTEWVKRDYLSVKKEKVVELKEKNHNEVEQLKKINNILDNPPPGDPEYTPPITKFLSKKKVDPGPDLIQLFNTNIKNLITNTIITVRKLGESNK